MQRHNKNGVQGRGRRENSCHNLFELRRILAMPTVQTGLLAWRSLEQNRRDFGRSSHGISCAKKLTLRAFVSEAGRESLTQTLEHKRCRSQRQCRKICARKTEPRRQRERPKRQPLTRYAKSPVRFYSARKTNFKKDEKEG